MNEYISNLSFTGTQINYFFICKRKLWLFTNQMEMEHSSDLVSLGKLLHESTYKRKTKEIQIGSIKIDFLEKGCEVHEVKKSKKAEEAHKWQMLYYLYYLKKHGIENLKGFINYPLTRQVVEIELTPEKEAEVEKMLEEVREILSSKDPPKAVKIPYCKRCSYYEFCWC